MDTKKLPKKKINYLNNKDLLADTIESLEQGKMSDKLAKKLSMLVERYAKSRSQTRWKGNFADYTYNDDMQGYAKMMLVKTWKSFNPDRSTNAFAFFTQCVKNSFVQYLNQERRQRDIRDKLLVDNGLDPSYTYADRIKKELAEEEDYEQY